MQRFFDEARCLPKENIRWLRGTIDGGSTIHSGNLVHQPPIQILLEESPFGGIGVTHKPKAFDHEGGKIFKYEDRRFPNRRIIPTGIWRRCCWHERLVRGSAGKSCRRAYTCFKSLGQRNTLLLTAWRGNA